MRLSEYLRTSGRSVNEIHCASRVRYATVLALSKNEVLLTRVDVAQRIVKECEGEVGLGDLLKPNVLAAVNSENAPTKSGRQSGADVQRPKPARKRRSA